MKFILTLLISFLSLLFFSCQKEFSATIDPTKVDTTGTTPSSNKIKTYTEDITAGGLHVVVTFNVAYDASDRVISLTSASSPGDKFLYTYNSNNTIELDLYNSNVITIHEIFFLNSSSLLDSTFQYNDTQDTSTEKYIYNASKQLIQVNQYDYTTATGSVLDDVLNYTYDAMGNVIKEQSTFTTTTFDYYDTINNLLLFPYLSIKPTHLIKTTKITNSGTMNTINHTYTFDNKNRVISEKQEVAGSSEVVIRSYTYY
ncbi:MAG: hypothetical protein ABIN97_06675 [Ginsengibacter sp.]